VGGGIMDQFVSVYGEIDKALFLNTKNNDYKLIPLFNDYSFQIIDSGKKRILSDSAFNDRKKMCNKSTEKMSLQYLCEKDKIGEKDKNLLSVSEFKISKHVIEENIRSKKGLEALLNNDPKLFGKLMTQSHNSLANDYAVSCSELDQLVQLCNEYGTIGAKLTGAGFGGAIVALIKNNLVEGLFFIRATIAPPKPAPVNLAPIVPYSLQS
jgi:galactokinase